ncbi:MAG: hypothetical protein R3B89_17120 [Polyangiaceae bacterium]
MSAAPEALREEIADHRAKLLAAHEGRDVARANCLLEEPRYKTLAELALGVMGVDVSNSGTPDARRVDMYEQLLQALADDAAAVLALKENQDSSCHEVTTEDDISRALARLVRRLKDATELLSRIDLAPTNAEYDAESEAYRKGKEGAA